MKHVCIRSGISPPSRVWVSPALRMALSNSSSQASNLNSLLAPSGIARESVCDASAQAEHKANFEPPAGSEMNTGVARARLIIKENGPSKRDAGNTPTVKPVGKHWPTLRKGKSGDNRMIQNSTCGVTYCWLFRFGHLSRGHCTWPSGACHRAPYTH